MSATTPGFVGERLTEARKARGISGADLADLVDVSPQSISKYENGHAAPRMDMLLKLSGALRFPQAYFMRPKIHNDSKPIFWRGKLSAPAGKKDRARVRLEWMKESIDYLSQFLIFPDVNVPYVSADDLEAIDADYLDEVAQEIRSQWEIRPGPMPDVIERLEGNGVLVWRIHVHAEKLDAFSQWSDKFNVPFMVLGRDKASAVRQRFDALHELAHLVLHRTITQKQFNRSTCYKHLEQQADKLAGRLLLPEHEFVQELYAPTLDGFLALKERWGASIGAMIMRCRELNILDEAETTRMWINYTRRGWRKTEPLDDVLEKEEPLMIRRGFEILLSDGVQTVSEITKALPFPVSDLEELADLEPGTLGGRLESRATPKLKSGSDEEGDNVVQFTR